MSLGWIYAFKDRGFDRGVKIGRDADHPTRFKRAQCYTPRGIDVVAVWHAQRGFATLAQAENTARRGLPRLAGRNNGVEWCDLTPEEAVARVSANLAADPELFAGNPRITSTYDDFRDPKILGRERHRQLLWIYRENQTGALKVQRTCSWQVPLEPVKTYSLLGFKPVACVGLPPSDDLHGDNRFVHRMWEEIVMEFGHGSDHIQVGWLRSSASVDVVLAHIERRGLRRIQGWARCPPGVRPIR